MHAKVKLKDSVTDSEAKEYGRVFAATVNARTKESYIVGVRGTRLTTETDAQLNPIQGSTHEKTVGDSLPNPDNPVTAKYITTAGATTEFDPSTISANTTAETFSDNTSD